MARGVCCFVVRSRGLCRSACGSLCVPLRWFGMASTAALLLAPGAPALAAVGGGGTGNNTFTTLTTDSKSTTVVVPGSGPLSGLLTQILAGPNGAAIGNALSAVLGGGSGTFSQTFVTTVSSIGPTTIPFGNNPNPGKANCNGPPSGWPATNCDYTGYTTFSVAAGTTNLNTNTDYDLTTTLVVNANSSGLNWLTGDLFTTVQTTLIDQEFNFVDGLLGRGGMAGMPASAPLAMQYTEVSFGDDAPAMALGYASERGRSAYAAFLKAPPLAERGVWTAWARGEYGAANFSGNSANFGFGYRSGGGTAGIDYRKGEWLFGAAGEYGRANVTQDTTNDSAAIDTCASALMRATGPGRGRSPACWRAACIRSPPTGSPCCRHRPWRAITPTHSTPASRRRGALRCGATPCSRWPGSSTPTCTPTAF